MNSLKAPSLQSLMDSDRASNDSQFTDYNIQLDLEELDDQEYALPSVDTLPTLESVLHDLESEFDDESDLGRISSTATPTPSTADPNQQQQSHHSSHTSRIGSMLRHSTLHSVSNQISSAADRVNAGYASSVAVEQMIAVGTSHGHILCFDNAQVLRWCCQEYVQQGAVSSLAFNVDNSRLLAGFARGTIVMIDTLSGDALRSLSDAVTPNTGVLSIKWTDRPATALCLDSGGSVWSLSFTRRLGIRSCESRCLFSGARGEVCAIEPLQLMPDDPHPMKAHSLVAMATLSKFFVVVLRPRLKVVKVHAVSGPPDTLPLISWHVVLIESADSSRRVDPVLAAARGNQLFFHQVFVHGNSKVNLIPLRHITMGYELLAMKWLGSKHILTCDRSEVLHLIDVRSNKELESYDMCKVGMVYNSAQFKALATGGNVSPALALAGTYACYNSLAAVENQLYILGSRSLHVVSVRPWSDRISHLSANGKWTEAISLAIEGFRGATNRPMRQEMAKNRILQLIEEYVAATSNTPENSLDAVMACLVEIGEEKLLWEELWDRLDNTDYFISLLTQHIEQGHITTVSTQVAQTICDYWAPISIARLEDVLLKLNWQCLDLHQVLTLAKRSDMFRVQMHLFSKALGDFTIALIDLIPRISTSKNSDLGNHLLVYVSSSLAGRGYPSGELPAEVAKTAKHDVLRALTVIHSISATDDELKYPYLRQLLNFDTRETLNVISLAFQEPEFSGDLGMLQRQRLVNILLEILVWPEHATGTQVGALMGFIAGQLANRLLPPDPVLIDRVFTFVARTRGDATEQEGEVGQETVREHLERENAWLDLLSVEEYLEEVPMHELVRQAKAAGCYRVLEYLYERTRSFDEILDCYLLDKTRHHELYAYLHRYADEPEREVYPQIATNLIQLLEINASELGKVLCECYADRIKSLIGVLDKQSVELFRLMETISEHGVVFEPEDCELYVELLCLYGGQEAVVERFLQNPVNKYRLDVALETVERCNLRQASVFLYEKRGDFRTAFKKSLELLKSPVDGDETDAESQALKIASLCVRASESVTDEERVELWTMLLDVVLLRTDLVTIKKQVLHMASGHMDLTQLVQMVLASASGEGETTGKFGDIRHLLMGMLANSRYEMMLLETTARVLGTDLHGKFVRQRNVAKHGLAIRTMVCVECGHQLRGGGGEVNEKVVVFGSCGHAVHDKCSLLEEQDEAGFKKCPRCRRKANFSSPVRIVHPKMNPFEEFVERRSNGDGLQLGAPTRLK